MPTIGRLSVTAVGVAILSVTAVGVAILSVAAVGHLPVGDHLLVVGIAILSVPAFRNPYIILPRKRS